MRQSCSLKTLKSWTHNKDQMFQHALFMHPSACFSCPQNTSIFLPFKHTAHSQSGWFHLVFFFFTTVCRACVCHLESWNNLRTFPIRLQLKTAETETGVLLFDVQNERRTDAQNSYPDANARAHAAGLCCARGNACNALRFSLPSLAPFPPAKSTPMFLVSSSTRTESRKLMLIIRNLLLCGNHQENFGFT